MSRTRWSARVDSVKQVSAHLPATLEALEDLKLLNLTSECRRDIQGLEKYFKTFNCLLLASIWFKILKSIDIVNRVLQCKSGTLDVASKNLSSLIEDLHKIRNEGYDNILNETLIVAKNIGWPQYFKAELKRTRKRKRHIDEDDENENADDHQRTKFKNDVFNIILDSVIGDMTIQEKTTRLVKQYPKDLGDELTDELQSLRLICIFSQLWIFITIPATVASAERSFSVLKRVKNVLRSTMCQNRLPSLGVLAVEKELAKNTNLDAVIDDFAMKKARKGTL
ncbi:hypothetical protein QTP88_001872 [Uroleucon formosanum]